MTSSSDKLPSTSDKAMNAYMEQQGIVWDNQSQSYVKSQLKNPIPNNRPSKSNKYIPLLGMLLTNKDKLEALLQTSSRNPSKQGYNFRNNRTTKTIFISKELQSLIKKYGKEYGLLQSEVIELALVQFFLSNGYEKYLKEISMEKNNE